MARNISRPNLDPADATGLDPTASLATTAAAAAVPPGEECHASTATSSGPGPCVPAASSQLLTRQNHRWVHMVVGAGSMKAFKELFELLFELLP